jgi:hypothetical protein
MHDYHWKKVIKKLYLTKGENCYISSYWNCISSKKADFFFQFLHRGQKRLWFFCLLILLSKLLSATQHSAKTKFIPRCRAAAQNLAPLPFLCFQSLSSKSFVQPT